MATKELGELMNDEEISAKPSERTTLQRIHLNKGNIEFDFVVKGEESNFESLIIFGSILAIVVSMASCAIVIKYRNKKAPINVKIKKETKQETSNRADNYELRVQVQKEPIYDIPQRPS